MQVFLLLLSVLSDQAPVWLGCCCWASGPTCGRDKGGRLNSGLFCSFVRAFYLLGFCMLTTGLGLWPESLCVESGDPVRWLAELEGDPFTAPLLRLRLAR